MKIGFGCGLLVVVLIGFPCYSLADTLDLKTTEAIYLERNFAQKASAAFIRASHEDVTMNYSKFLPKVDLKERLSIDREARMSLAIEQPLPYPPQWIKSQDILENVEKTAVRTRSLERQDLLNKLHVLYFNIQLLEKKKALALQNFGLIEQIKKENEQRFAEGYIAQGDLRRATLDFLDLQRTLQVAQSGLESAKRQMMLFLERKDSSFVLATELNLGKRLLTMTADDFRAHLQSHNNENIAIKKLANDSAQLAVDAFPYRYLPTLSLGAEFYLREHDRDSFFTANLSWNLFNGLSDRAEERKAYAMLENADYLYKDQIVQVNTSGEKLLNEILDGRTTYLQQEEALKMWVDIMAASHQRFQKGLSSTKDLSDDIRRYLEYANNFYEGTFETLSKVSEFCFLVGKEDLFHELML